MNTSLISEDGLKRKLEFTIPKEDVERSFSNQFQKYQKDAKIPGFRKGKAPQEKIKETYSGKAWQVVLDSLFQDFYPKVIKEHQLNPAGRPKLIDVKLKEKEPCVFTIEVEVHPEIKVTKYKKLKIKKIETKVTDEQIEETLKKLQDSFANSKEGSENQKKTSEMNEEFLSRFKVKTVQELKDRIKKDLQELNEQKAKEQMENKVIEKLVESNPISLPESLIEEQKENLKQNAQRRLGEYGIQKEEQIKWLKEKESEFEKEARFSVHSGYLIETLIKDLKMQPTKEDINKSLQESFPNKKSEEMKKELQKGNYWNYFIFNLTRKQVIDYIKKEADIS